MIKLKNILAESLKRFKVYIVGEREPLILMGKNEKEVKKTAHMMIRNSSVKIKKVVKEDIIKEDFLRDVIKQIGQRTFRYVGAKNFVKGKQRGMPFIQFDVKGRRMKQGGRILVYYNRGKDLYNVEGWIIRNLKAKKVITKKDIGMENLGDTIERITG